MSEMSWRDRRRPCLKAFYRRELAPSSVASTGFSPSRNCSTARSQRFVRPRNWRRIMPASSPGRGRQSPTLANAKFTLVEDRLFTMKSAKLQQMLSIEDFWW